MVPSKRILSRELPLALAERACPGLVRDRVYAVLYSGLVGELG